LLGSDGIGDSEYIIDGNIDNYPLITPYSAPPPPTYALTITTTAGGTTNPAPGTYSYTADLWVQVTAIPNTGYLFDHWELNNVNVGSANPYLFLMNRDYTLEAVFSPTLTIHSLPIEVIFTADGVSHTTPWTGTYVKGTQISLVMPEIQVLGETRYYWSQWSDGITTRSRAVAMNTNITLTAYYNGPYHKLTVTSSPMTGITFTMDGVLKTTLYTGWLLAGSHTLEMPKTYNGYVWTHWLEDGDTSRTKIIILSGTTWTGVFVQAPPPPPVGGYSFQIEGYTKAQPITPYLALIAIITIGYTTIRRKATRKTK
jgi:hypothetical protein